jgi:hypothetical protein
LADYIKEDKANGHVERMGEMGKACGKPEEKRPLRRPKIILKYIIMPPWLHRPTR